MLKTLSTTMLAAFAVLMLSVAPVRATSDPVAVVNAFYTAYMSNSSAKMHAAMKQDFAESTLSLYERAQAANSKGDLVLDYDPFNSAQVATYAFAAGKATISANVADVPVALAVGLHKTDKLTRHMDVVLHRIAGTWRIWDFVCTDKDGGGSFRKNVTKALAYQKKT